MSKQEAAKLLGLGPVDIERETESIDPEAGIEPMADPCDLADWHNEEVRAADAVG